MINGRAKTNNGSFIQNLLANFLDKQKRPRLYGVVFGIMMVVGMIGFALAPNRIRIIRKH